MRTSRHLLAASLLLILSLGATIAIAKKKPAPTPMDERERALHALNRLTFGPRPGDVERVTAMGVDKWIEQQLHPEKIDDSALQARLAGFRTLNMDAKAMLQNFPPPQEIKQMERRGGSLPHDPEKRAIYEAAIDKQERKQENKQAKVQDTAQGDAQNADPQMMDDAARLKRRAEMRE